MVRASSYELMCDLCAVRSLLHSSAAPPRAPPRAPPAAACATPRTAPAYLLLRRMHVGKHLADHVPYVGGDMPVRAAMPVSAAVRDEGVHVRHDGTRVSEGSDPVQGGQAVTRPGARARQCERTHANVSARTVREGSGPRFFSCLWCHSKHQQPPTAFVFCLRVTSDTTNKPKGLKPGRMTTMMLSRLSFGSEVGASPIAATRSRLETARTRRFDFEGIGFDDHSPGPCETRVGKRAWVGASDEPDDLRTRPESAPPSSDRGIVLTSTVAWAEAATETAAVAQDIARLGVEAYLLAQPERARTPERVRAERVCPPAPKRAHCTVAPESVQNSGSGVVLASSWAEAATETAAIERLGVEAYLLAQPERARTPERVRVERTCPPAPTRAPSSRLVRLGLVKAAL